MKTGLSKLFLASLFSIALLTACGGGGGSTPTSPVVPPVTTVPLVSVYQAANLVAIAPSPSYSAGSEELAAYNHFNGARVNCGFGALTQKSAVDTAAINHSNWVITNGKVSHVETTGSPGFTGINPSDRGVFAGYGKIDTFQFSEVISARFYVEKTGYGVRMAKNLLNAPYHLNAMMRGYRDVGTAIAVVKAPVSSRDWTVLAFNLGNTNVAGPQSLASDEVGTYPCEGTTGVNIGATTELPSPVPGRDMDSNPIGLSFYVGVRDGNTITVTSAVVTNLSTGNPEKIGNVLTRKTDPNGQSGNTYFESNQAVVFTDKPASPNTKYSVVINGTNNDKPFTRNFSFTTGTGGLE